MENIYKKYAEITASIKALEEEKKLVNDQILQDLSTQEVNQCKSEVGTFSLVERKTWKYSDAVKTKEQEVKELKKEEESIGIANSSSSFSLRFQSK